MMQQMHERERLYHLDKPGLARAAVPPPRTVALPPGWIGLQDCNISPVQGRPMPIPYVLLHPELGVALVDIAPAETMHAEAAFRSRLEAARFAAIFPGHLPILHLVLQPGELARLATLLPEAFATQPPVSLPGGDGWVSGVRRALAPRDGVRSAPRPGVPTAEPDAPPVALNREVAAHRLGAQAVPEEDAAVITLPASPGRRLALPVGLGLAGLAAAAAVVFMLRNGPEEPAPATTTLAALPERAGASEPTAGTVAGTGSPPRVESAVSQPPAPPQNLAAPPPARTAAPRAPEPAVAAPPRERQAGGSAASGAPPAAVGGGSHVVVRAAANLRAGPDKKSAVLRIVPQGEVLREFSRGVGGWVEVGDTRPQGWIYDKLVEPAKP